MAENHEQQRLKALVDTTSREREWAAKEFDDVQKRVLVDRSSFFDRLALFNGGSIAATITFSGVLHQLSLPAIHWRYVLFTGWILLLFSMIASLARNWQAQNAWYHTVASTFNKYEGADKEAYAALMLGTFRSVDLRTGDQIDRSKISDNKAKIHDHFEEQTKHHQLLAKRAEGWRLRLEKGAFLATILGIALALAFAMRNFS